MEYDKVILLAENKNKEVITACRWGKVWHFVYESKTDGGRIGASFNSLSELLATAKNYILNECGYNFKQSDLTAKCNQVELTDDQRVALNMAISLLSRSNSDHADQCVYHLKTI